VFDREGYEFYVRQRISLERKLEEVGDDPVSREVESQMRFAEVRMLTKIKQAHNHATQEMDALRAILTEANKPGF